LLKFIDFGKSSSTSGAIGDGSSPNVSKGITRLNRLLRRLVLGMDWE
jgi:hypothetical protein